MLLARLTLLALSASWALCAQQVVLYLDKPLPEPAVASAMRAEFAKVAAPFGIQPEWRTLSDNTGSGESSQIIVIHLSGDCSTSAPSAEAITGAPIASVQQSNGRILPFVEVQCGVLTALVQATSTSRATARQRSLLGRALARVLAHEVYHIHTQTPAHTHGGITQARLNTKELVGVANF